MKKALIPYLFHELAIKNETASFTYLFMYVFYIQLQIQHTQIHLLFLQEPPGKATSPCLQIKSQVLFIIGPTHGPTKSGLFFSQPSICTTASSAFYIGKTIFHNQYI